MLKWTDATSILVAAGLTDAEIDEVSNLNLD
jgi:hypothetical protein